MTIQSYHVSAKRIARTSALELKYTTVDDSCRLVYRFNHLSSRLPPNDPDVRAAMLAEFDLAVQKIRASLATVNF